MDFSTYLILVYSLILIVALFLYGVYRILKNHHERKKPKKKDEETEILLERNKFRSKNPKTNLSKIYVSPEGKSLRKLLQIAHECYDKLDEAEPHQKHEWHLQAMAAQTDLERHPLYHEYQRNQNRSEIEDIVARTKYENRKKFD